MTVFVVFFVFIASFFVRGIAEELLENVVVDGFQVVSKVDLVRGTTSLSMRSVVRGLLLSDWFDAAARAGDLPQPVQLGDGESIIRLTVADAVV